MAPGTETIVESLISLTISFRFSFPFGQQIMNQHCDAKELCALYISSGVPIYPYSLGHSYHTMVWRMGIEAKEMRGMPDNGNPQSASGQDANAVSEPDALASPRMPVDRFFFERYEARAREGLNYAISYLEEKSMYMLNAEKNANDASSFAQSVFQQMSVGPNRFVLRPPHNHGHVLNEDGNIRIPGEATTAEGHGRPVVRRLSSDFPNTANNEVTRRRVTRSNSHSDLRCRRPKIVVKVHRHLLDQHLLGRHCVDDWEGTMRTSSVNLSADFFHPFFKIRGHCFLNESVSRETATNFTSSDGFVAGDLLPPLNNFQQSSHHTLDLVSREMGMPLPSVDHVAGMRGQQLPPGSAPESDSDGEQLMLQDFNAAASIFEPPTGGLDAATIVGRDQVSFAPLVDLSVPNPYTTPTHPNILANVDLEVYSASSANKKSDADQQGDREILNNLRTRFAVYQRKLENLLAQHDSDGFDECMLDFWDEFLPQTASIHYHDRNTAVPRISCLHKFLTKPCPKAIGVVQCEIERIKLGLKKKGVNVKGRFFPTYEYRLFIRHRPAEAMDRTEPPRRDTVLMMAKNRGRKYVESSSSVTSKKGANNYYLYVPLQDDVEQHFKSVNGMDIYSKSITNGPSNIPMISDGPNMMGRLQSNFIGTEFQIFTQHGSKRSQNMKNPPTRSHTTPVNAGPNPTCSSEEDYGYDSAVSSDNPSSSSRRKGRFGRLSGRRNGGAGPPEQSSIAECDSRTRPLRRSRSSGDVNENNRRCRTSRRAIANSSEGIDAQRPHPLQLEEEDGAITYTANLLGSRPRIMDVCIPKVSPDGVSGLEWRKYLDKCVPDNEGGTGNRMLHHLKQLQQRMENEDHGLIRSRQNAGESEATDSGGYSPPDDFGLLALQNRPPWWNVELGSFVLNFGGRVSVASVKNFQLCDRTDQDHIMLQFGRIQGRHSFTMDFQHPLTAVQAFAIAISSLQSKISFG